MNPTISNTERDSVIAEMRADQQGGSKMDVFTRAVHRVFNKPGYQPIKIVSSNCARYWRYAFGGSYKRMREPDLLPRREPPEDEDEFTPEDERDIIAEGLACYAERLRLQICELQAKLTHIEQLLNVGKYSKK